MNKNISFSNGLRSSFLLCLTAINVGCSDFFNSDSNQLKVEKPTETTRENSNFFDKISEGEPSEQKVLAHYLSDAVSPQFENLKNRSQLFEIQINDLCKTAEWEASQLKLSQELYRELLIAFRKVEPLTIPESVSKNEDWPISFFDSTNFFACSADLKFIDPKPPGEPITLGTDLGWPGGFLKYAEYYLFTDANKQSCDLDEHPEMKEVYSKLPVSQQRCNALKSLSKVVVEKTTNLNEHLKIDSAEIKKFVAEFETDKKQFLTPVLESMFFLESFKDAKLGKPLGLSKDCLSPTRKCPQNIEDNLSNLSYESFEAILSTLKLVFFGAKGAENYSIAALLKAKGHSSVVSRFNMVLGLANFSVEDLQKGPTFEKVINAMDVKACARTTGTSREVKVCTLFQDLKELSTILRSEIITVFSAGVPVQHQGDSD